MFGDLRGFAQAIANDLMDTPVVIHAKGSFKKDSDNPYSDDTLEFDPVGVEVTGWFVSAMTRSLSAVGGMNAGVDDDTVRLPVGTAVKPGDKIVINGNDWYATDASTDETWPAMTKVAITRIR